MRDSVSSSSVVGQARVDRTAGLLIIVSGTWGFIELAGAVLEEYSALDQWVLQSLHALTGRAMAAVDAGDCPRHHIPRRCCRLVAGHLAVTGFLLLDRKYAAMGVVILATLSGLGLSVLLKALFARPRPDVVPHLTEHRAVSRAVTR